jgi:hypothetical protein
MPSRIGARSRPRLLRTIGWLAVASLIAIAVLAPVGVSANDAPGNNGTAKIHEGPPTEGSHADPPKTDRNNQPHVCDFHVHGFNFDSDDSGVWRIYAWPPTGDGEIVIPNEAWSGEEWMSRFITELPDGHYRLVVNITGDAGPEEKDVDFTADKHKVFWVDCEEGGGEQPVSPSPSPSPSPPSGPSSPSPSPSPSPPTAPSSPSPSPSPSLGGGQAPASPSPSPSAPGGAVLPTEGTPGGEEQPGEGAPTGGEAGITPPPTETIAEPASRPTTDTWRFALLGLAGLLAGVLVLTPASVVDRRRR